MDNIAGDLPAALGNRPASVNRPGERTGHRDPDQAAHRLARGPLMAEQWFPTRRRFDEALDALHRANEQHRTDLTLIGRLEQELDLYRKADRDRLETSPRGARLPRRH